MLFRGPEEAGNVSTCLPSGFCHRICKLYLRKVFIQGQNWGLRPEAPEEADMLAMACVQSDMDLELLLLPAQPYLSALPAVAARSALACMQLRSFMHNSSCQSNTSSD